MKKRYLAAIAAALLTVSPLAVSSSFISGPYVVKAATLSSDQLMAPYYNDLESKEPDAILKLNKTNSLTAYNGETVAQLAKQRIKDVTSNYGHITNQEDFLVYETRDDGRPDWDNVLRKDEKLKAGQDYVVLISYDVNSISSSLGNDVYYVKSDGSENDDLDTTDETYGGNNANSVALLLPLTVSSTNYRSSVTRSNTSATKHSATTTHRSTSHKVYITARRNHRVRTYTSTGKFSHHYVYGHHNYKVTSKKRIAHRGTCYKLLGKNQWVLAKYCR